MRHRVRHHFEGEALTADVVIGDISRIFLRYFRKSNKWEWFGDNGELLTVEEAQKLRDELSEVIEFAVIIQEEA